MRTALTSLLLTVAAAVLLAACGGDTPRDEYLAFLERVDRTNPNLIDADAARGRGMVADIRGQHVLNVDLKPIGAVRLPLRASILTFEELPEGTEEWPDARGRITGEFRLAEADPDRFEPRSEALAEFESFIEEDGFMEINLGRVYVPASLSPIPDTAVDVILNFKAVILDEDSLCGYIDDPEVTVISPAPLGLVGTTFGSRRWNDDGSQPPNVPETCPFSLGLPDGPPVEPGDPGDLAAPGIDTPYGQLADIAGRFFMRAAVSGSALVLDFILDGTVEELEEGVDIPSECSRISRGTRQFYRGELRTFTDDDRYGPDDPTVGEFCAQISENGRFNAIVEGIVAPSSLGEVNGDIALSAVILDENTYCATAAGSVTTPLSLNLAGSTAGFVRLPDDFWGLPDEPLQGCPPVVSPPPASLDDSGDRQDVTGRWFFSVRATGGVGDRDLTFRFVGDISYFAEEEDESDAVIDAFMRRFGDGYRPTDPAVGFVTGIPVTEDGQFTLQVNGPMGVDAEGREVNGNIGMRVAIRGEDVLCGRGNGRIFRPFQAPFTRWTISAGRLPGNVWGELEVPPACD